MKERWESVFTLSLSQFVGRSVVQCRLHFAESCLAVNDVDETSCVYHFFDVFFSLGRLLRRCRCNLTRQKKKKRHDSSDGSVVERRRRVLN